MKFKIEKGIEMPSHRAPKYGFPFDKMKPGQSFALPNDEEGKKLGSRVHQFCAYQNQLEEKNNSLRRFRARKMDGTFRVFCLLDDEAHNAT